MLKHYTSLYMFYYYGASRQVKINHLYQSQVSLAPVGSIDNILGYLEVRQDVPYRGSQAMGRM
jgi:hypothetical protein